MGSEQGFSINPDTKHLDRRPEGRKSNSSKWVFSITFVAAVLKSMVIRHIVCLAAYGYKRVEGSDIFERYASVLRFTFIRVILAASAASTPNGCRNSILP